MSRTPYCRNPRRNRQTSGDWRSVKPPTLSIVVIVRCSCDDKKPDFSPVSIMAHRFPRVWPMIKFIVATGLAAVFANDLWGIVQSLLRILFG